MYPLRTLCQFLIFFTLFLVTHYWMSTVDAFSPISFSVSLPLLISSSTYMSLLVVFLIQLFSLTSNRLVFRLLAFGFSLIQIYMNFTYFEYFLVFKTPLYGKDIIYMENPASVWQLTEGLVWNIRFPLLVLLPSLALFLTFFSVGKTHRDFVSKQPRLRVRSMVWMGMIALGLSLYFSYPQWSRMIANRSKIATMNLGYFSYERNPLISIYEAIANYLQFKPEFPIPEDITRIRDAFPESDQRVFVNDDYPLLQRGVVEGNPANPKNVIVLMMESFPSAEIYALTGNPDYEGTTPFLDEFLPQTLYFPNAYASGFHTFYGFSDFLVGNASYQYLSWNKKITQVLPQALPRLLERNGYRELGWYYGGGDIHFDLMYSFSETTGFNRRFFYNQYSSEMKNGNWGKSDRETLMQAARDIKTFEGPFLSYTLSLTKHGPWNTPPDFDEAGFERDFLSRHGGKIPNPGLVNTHRLVYYYDQILREFFETLEGTPQFENSLVIITADQAFFPNVEGGNLYETVKNGFNIPLILYEPGRKTFKPGRNEVFASHLDLIPTLIGYLGLGTPEEIPYQGRNLLDPRYQAVPDDYFHVAFWQDDLLHFTRDGFYRLSGNHGDSGNDDVIFVNRLGEESPSPSTAINRMMRAFKSVYPYLINENKVFP